MTYRATSSLRLADTTGAVRARTGVFWGAASLAPKQVEAFIESAMIAKCGSRLGLQPGAFLSLLGFCISSRPWRLGYRRAEARALEGRASQHRGKQRCGHKAHRTTQGSTEGFFVLFLASGWLGQRRSRSLMAIQRVSVSPECKAAAGASTDHTFALCPAS